MEIDYLFVCRLNARRSKTCAQYFLGLLRERGIVASVETAGIYRGRKVTNEICMNASKIFVMEAWMTEELIKDYQADPKKIVNLEILDVYQEGRFAQEGLEWTLRLPECKGKEGEIMSRPEINEQWDLMRVIESRNLGQYIQI